MHVEARAADLRQAGARVLAVAGSLTEESGAKQLREAAIKERKDRRPLYDYRANAPQDSDGVDMMAIVIAYKTSKNARVLFVGINPHPGSYRRGVPFSNNKMFWYLLNRSGLLEEAESDLKDDRLLKRIYDEKFLPKYGLNFLNLVDRPTVDVTQLKHGEEQAGIRRALKIIGACKPRVVCFIGKIAFNTFYGSKKCEWGWQVGISDSRVYLMHFPIRGSAEVRVKELREVKKASEDQKP